MSAYLSVELLIRGEDHALDDFMNALRHGDETILDKNILILLGEKVIDEGSGFVELSVERKDDDKSVALTWIGGFGGFDSYYINESFRDYGILLSEMFPWLEFRLYYDSDGANFAGSYSYEEYMEGTKVIREDVFAGGVCYKAGVRIGEASLTWEEYFMEERCADDSDDGFQYPGHDNNRKIIDDAIDSGHIRPSTLLRRRKWHEAHVDYAESPFLLGTDFWREVPLINTEADYIDKTVAISAFKQSPFSILFFHPTLISKNLREKAARNIPALRLFLADPGSKQEEREFDHNSSRFAEEIMSGLRRLDNSQAGSQDRLMKTIDSKDIVRYKREIILCLRQLALHAPEPK